MSTVLAPAEQRVLLDHVSWATYQQLCAEPETRRGRIAYDQGTLEIMSPSKLHAKAKTLLARMIEAYTEEASIEIESAGSTTFQREDLQRGIEADECYYVQHAEAIRERDDIDLALDPPPDLAIEVEISRPALNKLGIYRALGIPEVWRYDGERLRIYLLQDDSYRESFRSAAFPALPVEELLRFLSQRHVTPETQLIQAFRRWVRAELGRG